jgi:hypothetical protein
LRQSRIGKRRRRDQRQTSQCQQGITRVFHCPILPPLVTTRPVWATQQRIQGFNEFAFHLQFVPSPNSL